MAVTAVTITSGPTVVGRSVTLSGTLNRTDTAINNNLAFVVYESTFTFSYTINRLSDGATFLNAAGTAESGISWTWTGTLPEGNYLAVNVILNEPPTTVLATSATNIGIIKLRNSLPGIWTPRRDSRGFFTPKVSSYPSFIDGTRNWDKAASFLYPIQEGIYRSNANVIDREGEYGGIAKGVPTPYGLGIDTPRGWEQKTARGGYLSTSGGSHVLVSVFSLYNASKYLSPANGQPWPAVLGESRAKGVGYEFGDIAAWYKNESGEQALRINTIPQNGSYIPGTNTIGLDNIYVNGLSNGLYCLVLCYTVSGGAAGVRAFLNGQLVGTGPATNFASFWGIRSYYYWGSLSQSDLNMGNVHFNGHITNLNLTDNQAAQLSTDPYRQFFIDAPKTSANRRVFSGFLSLPNPPAQFKGGRFLAQRWKTQPRGALTIDRGHSLSRGLCAAWHPAAQQYIGPGIAPSPTPNTYAYEADASGMLGVKFNGAVNARIALPAGSAGFAADYSGTRLVLFQVNAANLGLVSGAVNSTLGMRLNTATTIGLVASGAAVISNLFYTIPTSTRPTVALCTADSASTQTRMHVNGQLLLNTTATYVASTAGVWVGAITNHSSASNFFLALSWDRALSIPEATAIQENPWQIFKPNPGRIYFLPGATRRGKFLFLFN